MVIGGNKMRAECQDVYMIRTPSLSLEYLEKYEKQEKDIYDFISQDKELDQFFRKALLVSSPTLYKNYINKPTDKKKYEKLKESLLKYFLRSIGRPTPYGYFAEVSLGQFGNETELERGDQILDIRVDNNWINQVVQVLEKHEEIQKRLKVRYNTLCYISGDRVKNPYFTNYGKAETGQTIIVENSIRYTKLNDLVKKEAVDFISLLELSNKVKLVYEDTPEVVIWKTLLDMLKSEYLISNLRTPAYCKNTLKYLIQELKTIGYSGEYFVKLESILTLLEKFREKENLDILIEIYATMEKIGKNKNYLIINLGDKYKKNTLDVSIKKQVEKLSEILYKIPVIYDSTYKLKEKFIETYGTYVEVPLTQIIDKNGFNGERLIELGRIESTREEKVIHIIGITFILKNLTKGLEEMFQILDSMGFQNNYRKEYREESRCYLQYVRSVLNECEEKYLDVKEEHLQEKRALKIYAKKLENQIKLKKNTNKKENIILSIIHMYCNRITGNRIYENKYLAIVRHALYQILQQEKHYPKIASKDII